MMDVLPAARTFAGAGPPHSRRAQHGDGARVTYWPAVHGSTWKDSQTMNDGMRANSTVDDGQWQHGLGDERRLDVRADLRGGRRPGRGAGAAASSRTRSRRRAATPSPAPGSPTTGRGGAGERATRARSCGSCSGEPNSLDVRLRHEPGLRREDHPRPALVLHVDARRRTARSSERAGTYFAAPGEPCIGRRPSTASAARRRSTGSAPRPASRPTTRTLRT